MGKMLKKVVPKGDWQKREKNEVVFRKLRFPEKDFFKYLSDNFISESSINKYITYVKCFFKEHKEFNENNIKKFLKKHPRKYAKSALKWYAEFSNINHNFPKRVKEPPKNINKKEYDIEELKQLLNKNYPNLGHTEKLIFEILLTTGKRISEVLNLKASDIQDNSLIFRMKGGYIQKIPLPERTIKKLQELAENTYLYGDLFYPGIKHKYLKLRYELKKAGLLELRRTHNFRRAVINYLIKKTDVITAKDFVGHKKIETTMRYVSERAKEERIFKAFNIISKEYE